MDLRCTGRLAAVFLAIGLTGCVGAVTEGANIARDKSIVSSNMEAARAGDAEAQYKVGKALCCSLNEGEGFYNTPQSVEWLCRSAEQKNGQAALKLGEIYTGDTITGIRVLRRVAQRVAGSSTDPAVGYSWLRRAESLGVADAREPAKKLWAAMAPADRERAEGMVTGRTALPCQWKAVFPAA